MASKDLKPAWMSNGRSGWGQGASGARSKATAQKKKTSALGEQPKFDRLFPSLERKSDGPSVRQERPDKEKSNGSSWSARVSEGSPSSSPEQSASDLTEAGNPLVLARSLVPTCGGTGRHANRGRYRTKKIGPNEPRGHLRPGSVPDNFDRAQSDSIIHQRSKGQRKSTSQPEVRRHMVRAPMAPLPRPTQSWRTTHIPPRPRTEERARRHTYTSPPTTSQSCGDVASPRQKPRGDANRRRSEPKEFGEARPKEDISIKQAVRQGIETIKISNDEEQRLLKEFGWDEASALDDDELTEEEIMSMQRLTGEEGLERSRDQSSISPVSWESIV